MSKITDQSQALDTALREAKYSVNYFHSKEQQLQCQIKISGILRKAENVRIEDDVAALDEDQYCSCVIDFLDYGDQTTATESAEIGDVSKEAEASNEVVQERPSETTVRTTRC